MSDVDEEARAEKSIEAVSVTDNFQKSHIAIQSAQQSTSISQLVTRYAIDSIIAPHLRLGALQLAKKHAHSRSSLALQRESTAQFERETARVTFGCLRQHCGTQQTAWTLQKISTTHQTAKVHHRYCARDSRLLKSNGAYAQSLQHPEDTVVTLRDL